MAAMTDAELARRCRQADPAAWRALIHRCSPLVYRLALRTLRNEADAEDVTQEVFLKIHQAFDTFDPSRPLAPWVSRITYNACLQRLRGAARRSLATEPDKLNGLEDSAARGPEEQAASQEASELLLAAMDHLPAQDRALITLRYREGLSDAELAEATRMKVNTVKTRLRRARLAIRQRLARMIKEPS